MPKRGTALNQGRMAEFVSAGTKALILIANELDPDLADNWARNGKAMQNAFLNALMPAERPAFESKPVFSLTLEGNKTTSELIKLGEYHWFHDWITDERFPIQPHAPLSRVIEYVVFDHDVGSKEVLAEFAQRDLMRSTYEDPLYFGIKYPEEQRKAPLVWLHEPVQGPNGFRSVLALDGGGRERGVRLDRFDGRWGRGCVFPAVRK